MPKFFGTDGIRGKSFTYLTAEIAYKVGVSLKEAYNSKVIVIGHDTRSSSPMLAHLVASGAMSAGIDVLFAGVVSTPMIAYYSKLKGIVGIMITASHNPYTDNGIKVFNLGLKSKIEEEKIIEEYILGKKYASDIFGLFTLSDDVEKEYLKLIDSLNIPKSNIKVVYDSANGANYLIANKVMSKYFPHSKQINACPDGKNINLKSGSTYLDAIKDYLKNNDYDLGFAYDGDGDRLLLVDSKLNLYDGDLLIYILAVYLQSKNKLLNHGVVLTKMSNPGLLQALKVKGIKYVLTDVGDKNVFFAMLKNDFLLGGEASGHIILRSLLDSGDGLLITIFILKVLQESKKTLEELVSDVKLYPFKMVNIENIDKEVLKKENVINFIKNYEQTLKEDDLLLIRASGTEPLIRVTLSIEDETKLNQDLDMLVDYIKNEGMEL